MHLLILDGQHLAAEFRQKFGPAHQYTFVPTAGRLVDELETAMAELEEALPTAEVVFDFGNYGPLYEEQPGLVVFLEAATESLTNRFGADAPTYPFFGFCGLPGLLSRPALEVSLYHSAHETALADACARLGTPYCVVADRVGLATPRLLAVLINEACWLQQEGAAHAASIRTLLEPELLARAKAVGLNRLYDVLTTLWDDTHDSRYKVSPWLKRLALRGETF